MWVIFSVLGYVGGMDTNNLKEQICKLFAFAIICFVKLFALYNIVIHLLLAYFLTFFVT